jgi:hypothetical protein
MALRRDSESDIAAKTTSGPGHCGRTVALEMRWTFRISVLHYDVPRVAVSLKAQRRRIAAPARLQNGAHRG